MAARLFPLVNPLTHTDWDGDAKSVGTYTITPTMFGYPTDAVAVCITLSAKWTSANTNYIVYARPAGSSGTGHIRVTSMVANITNDTGGDVALDSNASFEIVVAGAATSSTYLQVTGYYLETEV